MSILEILKKHPADTLAFVENGDLDSGDLYEDLYSYYSNNGEMPYGVAKGRDGDPGEWIGDRLQQELASPYKGWEMYKFLIQLPRLVRGG